MTAIERVARRVRHDLKFRLLEVRTVERLTPGMTRVTLGGAELAGFTSAAHDDHVKLFFPSPGQEKPVMPTVGPQGLVFADGVPRPAARDYTPRRYDAAAHALTIDFALHGEGVATRWAEQARPGHVLGVGGPRGSFVVPDDFDWYLLAGDETALPAIGRRLEELPAGAHALAVIEVADAGEEQCFESRAGIDALWLHRNGSPPGAASRLVKAVADIALPRGSGYAWVAAEADAAKALRRHLVEERGLAKTRVRAAAYWKRGASAVHETYDA
ncbi:MAG: siderophore-interacting protein [Proteobacteria bacterium]|nr:siderophore-interacting protein [Pseudomonadota bacterium]